MRSPQANSPPKASYRKALHPETHGPKPPAPGRHRHLKRNRSKRSRPAGRAPRLRMEPDYPPKNRHKTQTTNDRKDAVRPRFDPYRLRNLRQPRRCRPQGRRHAADTHRENPLRTPVRRRRDETAHRARLRPRHGLRQFPSRPRGDAGRDGADGAAAIHERRTRPFGRPRLGALRPPDPGRHGR